MWIYNLQESNVELCSFTADLLWCLALWNILVSCTPMLYSPKLLCVSQCASESHWNHQITCLYAVSLVTVLPMHYLHFHYRDSSKPDVLLDMISNRTTGPGKLLLKLALNTKVNEIDHDHFLTNCFHFTILSFCLVLNSLCNSCIINLYRPCNTAYARSSWPCVILAYR
jgi:hypothetical protein